MDEKSNFDISQAEVEILRDIKKVSSSKYKEIFIIMNEYYMKYLKIIQAMYKEKED